MNRRAKRIISTYACDTSGGPSALYELGGLSVIHDASGCNSTYTTHDEPRWYDMPSSVAITGLCEIDAVMGNDQKIIDDIESTVQARHPRFVSITSTPVPYVMGTDLDAVASIVEKQTGIPSWYCPSNGMHPYSVTVQSAIENYARRFILRSEKSKDFSVNLVGVTPLDFISQKRVDSIKAFLESEGIRVNSTLAMGDRIETIAMASEAHLDLACSFAGIGICRFMEKQYGIHFIAGLPYGKAQSIALVRAIKLKEKMPIPVSKGKGTVAIIGDCVQNHSILNNLQDFRHISITPCGGESDEDIITDGEEEIAALLHDADWVIADPLYKPIVPERCAFVPYPHFAFSGRMFENDENDPVYEGLDKLLEALK